MKHALRPEVVGGVDQSDGRPWPRRDGGPCGQARHKMILREAAVAVPGEGRKSEQAQIPQLQGCAGVNFYDVGQPVEVDLCRLLRS